MTTLLGRRRPVPELRASNRQTRQFGERIAVNFPMQGSNADIIKVAMIRSTTGCAPRAARPGSCCRCTTSCCSRFPTPSCSEVRELVRAEMCGAYDLDPPLAVDVGTGENWAEAKC